MFALSGFYNRWWRYVSTRDMWAALRGVGLATIATFLVFTLFDVHPVRVPPGVWFIYLLLCLAFVAGSRLLARTLIERPLPGQIVARGKEAIVVGAGDAAQLVVKEMQRNPASATRRSGSSTTTRASATSGSTGSACSARRATSPSLIRDRRPDEVLIAMPSASGELARPIVETARTARRAREDAARV